MEETLQHQAAPQRFGLPPTGTGNHRPDGTQANHALTFKLDHSSGADQLIGSSLKPEVIGATSSLVVLAAIFGVMLLAVSVIKWFETDGVLTLRGHRSSVFS